MLTNTIRDAVVNFVDAVVEDSVFAIAGMVAFRLQSQWKRQHLYLPVLADPAHERLLPIAILDSQFAADRASTRHRPRVVDCCCCWVS